MLELEFRFKFRMFLLYSFTIYGHHDHGLVPYVIRLVAWLQHCHASTSNTYVQLKFLTPTSWILHIPVTVCWSWLEVTDGMGLVTLMLCKPTGPMTTPYQDIFWLRCALQSQVLDRNGEPSFNWDNLSNAVIYACKWASSRNCIYNTLQLQLCALYKE